MLMLLDCLNVLKQEADWKAKLAIYVCDGGSVNLAYNGLKGYF